MATAQRSTEKPGLSRPSRNGRMIREICLIAVPSSPEFVTSLECDGERFHVTRRESFVEFDYLYVSLENPVCD